MTATTTFDLLDRARASLFQACASETTTDRYCEAHLAALRSAAAIVADREGRCARSRRRGAPVRDTWGTLARLAPEFSEWADYFALCGERRRAFETGQRAGSREADDLLRDAETFHALVLGALGLPVEVAAHPGLAVAGLRS
ncbi:MAG: SAV_6107 family HEPN domain-containing protein [Mobilicoccus sp.]|nr:SAV_6107 family HEPN domain-containing protein [Mobilicoccus sp.]